MNLNDTLALASKSVIGLSGSVLAVVMPWQEHFERGLLVASLMVGIEGVEELTEEQFKALLPKPTLP